MSSGEGKASPSPKRRRRRSMLRVMRAMLLFWEMRKPTMTSHRSCRRMRMPPPKAAAAVRQGSAGSMAEMYAP